MFFRHSAHNAGKKLMAWVIENPGTIIDNAVSWASAGGFGYFVSQITSGIVILNKLVPSGINAYVTGIDDAEHTRPFSSNFNYIPSNTTPSGALTVRSTISGISSALAFVWFCNLIHDAVKLAKINNNTHNHGRDTNFFALSASRDFRYRIHAKILLAFIVLGVETITHMALTSANFNPNDIQNNQYGCYALGFKFGCDNAARLGDTPSPDCATFDFNLPLNQVGTSFCIDYNTKGDIASYSILGGMILAALVCLKGCCGFSRAEKYTSANIEAYDDPYESTLSKVSKFIQCKL